MPYATRQLRNVTLLGHAGAGKSTLAEAMLFEAGALHRRGSVGEGNTVSDHTHIERERGMSLFSTLMHVDWRGTKINLVDAPGLDDFVGETVAALKVADTAVMVLNARNGVEVGTELSFEYLERYGTPTLLVVNHLDHDKADFEATLQQARERFGAKVLPVQYPLATGAGFREIVDALRMTVYRFGAEGGRPEKLPIPAEELDRAMAMHSAIVEAAAEHDDTLMERYFERGDLTEDELAAGLRIAVSNQQVYPVFCCSAERNMGSGRIMGFVHDICPSPADRPRALLDDGSELAPEADGPSRVFIYKTLSEPQVGNVSYFKVYSGTLRAGDALVNAANGQQERFNSIYVANGRHREAATELVAGDLGVAVKLRDAHTNQTLTAREGAPAVDRMAFPGSRIRVGIKPLEGRSMERLMRALHQLEEEDPTLRLEQSADLRQVLLHGQGQLHLDLVRYRVEKVDGIAFEFERPRIPYRETITGRAEATYRHKKQTGGAGQFAEVHLRLDPYTEGMPAPEGLNVRWDEVEELPWGGKLAFAWCIVSGSIDTRFAAAVKKGVLQRMAEGPLTGNRVRDVRVCVYDGKMHSVDSNDMAFLQAGAQAFRNAFLEAQPQLLEPVYDLEVLCPPEDVGDVMGDLQGRRAMITGIDADGHYQRVTAQVPLAELYKYSATIRSLTQGRAKFTRRLHGYQAVPAHVFASVVPEAEAVG